jgi:hypothetical protein
MPMPLRDFLSQNLLWKLGSLVLALLVWSVIQSTIREKTGPQAFLGESRQFVIPITVRTAASDPRGFSIRPNRIAVTLRGEIFGTDGVRGTANIEPVTAETALKLGRAAAHVFKPTPPEPRPAAGCHKIVIGKDTRLSGYLLENALSSGILSMGVDVLFIGPLPTPGVAYVTRSLRADAGIVITASHNPYATTASSSSVPMATNSTTISRPKSSTSSSAAISRPSAPQPARSARPCVSTTPSAATSSLPRAPSPRA